MTKYPQDMVAKVFAKAIYRAQLAVFTSIIQVCEEMDGADFALQVDRELKKLEDEGDKE